MMVPVKVRSNLESIEHIFSHFRLYGLLLDFVILVISILYEAILYDKRAS